MHKHTIHNELVKRLRLGPYHETSIDPETGEMSAAAGTISPVGVSVVERNASFTLAQKNMRTLTSERSSWVWEGHVQFPSTSVSVEQFEESLMDGCISISSDDSRSLLAALVASEYTYPPEQSPNGGTVVVFTFQILPISLRK